MKTMRKAFYLLLLTLLVPLGLNAQEKEMYTVLTDNTLTFYYDTEKESREGTKYDLSIQNQHRQWYNERANITKVVFDTTFADARPTSTSLWFESFSALTDIEGMKNLNTQDVTDMSYMFRGCIWLTNLDLSNFVTSNVTNMRWMFYDCSHLTSLDVSNFDTSNVTDMIYMFSGCSGLTSVVVSNFDTSNVTDMRGLFAWCSGLTSLDVSNFDTSNVTDMSNMFNGCRGLTSLDVSNFDTSNVTNMRGLFAWCSGLTSLDVSNFDTSNVTDIVGMFAWCSELTTIYCENDWSASDNQTASDYMFNGCTNLVGGNGTVYDESFTDNTYARPDTPETPGYFTSKTATSVKFVESGATLTQKSETLYDLQGRRQDVNQHAKGIYIMNGRKVGIR